MELRPVMRLKDLLKDVEGARLVRDAAVSGIAYDSRAVKPGDTFFAVPGTEMDGRKFIPDAVAKGASAVVTLSPEGIPRGVTRETGFVHVPDVRRALSQASNTLFGEPSKRLLVVGVTGTKGKTTTCHLVKSVLDAAGEKTGLIGTVHSIVGEEERPGHRTTPESTDLCSLMRDMVDAGSTAVTMEVSSHALVLLRVEDVLFDAAVLTNIGRDHLDFHKTMEDYAGAKMRLFGMLSRSKGAKARSAGPVAAVNADDAYAASFLKATTVPAVTYGMGKSAGLRATRVQPTSSGTTFTLNAGGKREQVRIALPGSFNVYNALAAAAVAFGLGFDLGVIAGGLNSAKGVRGRVEVVSGDAPYTVWVDYSHNPDSLENILTLARQVTSSKVIVVFGCGGDRDRGKRPIMGKIGGDLADLAIITSDNPRRESEEQILDDIEAGIRVSRGASSFLRIRDRREAINEAVRRAEPGDVVILAGKGHETYQEFADRTVHFDDAEVARLAIAHFRKA